MAIKLTQEEFDFRMQLLNNGIVALEPYAGNHVKIKFMCMYGHIWCATPSNVLHNKSGCPYCAGKRVLIGFNDLWTTRPDVARLLKDSMDGYRYVKGSKKKTDFRCPDCGTINNKNIDMVCRYGFVCQSCSDGVSYPNKFGRAFLDQLPVVNRQSEYSPSWANGRLYDNYFEYNGIKYILEMDGSFHYEEISSTKMSLEERRSIDALKDNLAIQHDIRMIRIDCRRSNCDYIKSNILSSDLNSIFDLSDIDWILCDIKSHKNLIKEVCELYNSGIHNLYTIKDMCHISIWAVRKYVQDGANFGWCDYTVEKSRAEGREKIMTPINVVDNVGSIVHNFSGINVCVDAFKKIYGVNLTSPNIIKSCQTFKPYKGFNFRYADDDKYYQQIEHLIDTSPLEDDFYF